ncbi:MAG: Ig-like domain-containing protein, partial [Oscillospiraceae bacterium]|nr:Ig-like domain-containing protein [Oscillospiraceae bacterium]
LAVMDAAFADHDKTLSVGDAATVAAAGTLSNTSSMLKEGGAAKFTYASSNPNFATVDGATGKVTAISGGVAKITATCSEAIDGYNSASTYIVVDEPSETVSFSVDSSVDGISLTSAYAQGEIVSVSRETDIEVSAPKTAEVGETTYVFRGWVRGSANNGRLISLEPTYSFTAMTNTYLTAIYTEMSNEEYYAWNGEFLGASRPESGSEPVVFGYLFKEWAKSDVAADLTRYVAQYEQLSTTYGVTYNGVTTQYKYNDEVTLSSDTAVYWYRDGKLIDYGTEYKFNVWDATVVTTSDEGHTLPKVILDDVIDNNYMIEYDAGDKTIIEAGILFSDAGTTPNINSCKEKIISQRSGIDHGQLTAKADYASARGYLVYKDGADYKVIYSE